MIPSDPKVSTAAGDIDYSSDISISSPKVLLVPVLLHLRYAALSAWKYSVGLALLTPLPAKTTLATTNQFFFKVSHSRYLSLDVLLEKSLDVQDYILLKSRYRQEAAFKEF